MICSTLRLRTRDSTQLGQIYTPTVVREFLRLTLLIVGVVCSLYMASCTRDNAEINNATQHSSQGRRSDLKERTFASVRTAEDARSIGQDVVTLFVIELSEDILDALVDHPQITELHIANASRLTDGTIARLGNMFRLTELYLKNGRIKSASFWEQLSALNSLQKLTLRFFHDISTECLTMLSRLPYVWGLDLSDSTFLSKDAVSELTSWPSLQNLTLKSVSGLENDSLGMLPMLSYLSLEWNGWLDDSGVAHLHRQTSAWAIGLENCSNVSAEAVAQLSKSLPECAVFK